MPSRKNPWCPRSKKARLKQLKLSLKQLEQRRPNGILAYRHSRVDDFNLFWQAGWPVSNSTYLAWLESYSSRLWVIYDTGDCHIVFQAPYERVLEVYQIYLIYGAENGLLLYDPRQQKQDRPLPYLTKRFAHKIKRGRLK